MMLSEFGSTGIEEISVFHALSAGNGMNPFRSAPRPVSMPPHVPLCVKLSLESESSERLIRIMSFGVFISGDCFCWGGVVARNKTKSQTNGLLPPRPIFLRNSSRFCQELSHPTKKFWQSSLTISALPDGPSAGYQ